MTNQHTTDSPTKTKTTMTSHHDQITAIKGKVRSLEARLGDGNGWMVDAMRENLKDMGMTEPELYDDSAEALAWHKEFYWSLETEAEADGLI